jgi:hypothetical protein
MNKAPHTPHAKANLLKGGIDPIQRALSSEEMDEQMERDIEAAQKHAAKRIAEAKRACEERRKRKESLHNAERIHGDAGAGKPRETLSPLDDASC